MSLFNKKGLLPVQIAFLGMAFAMIIAGVVLTPSHRVNQANKKCVALGDEPSICKDKVNAMTPEERLAYIKDTMESPSSVWDK